MQVTTFGSGDGDNSPDLAEILGQSTILSMVDHCGARMHVLQCNVEDVLAFTGGSNGGFVTYPCRAFDAEFGGSVHDQARTCIED